MLPKKTNKLIYTWIDSLLGPLCLVGEHETVHAIHIGENAEQFQPRNATLQARAFSAAKLQLTEYFKGKRFVLDFPIAYEGTAFQKQAWETLRRIPYGETRSYGAIAAQMGKPQAARAVGNANNRNPLPLVIPCHRVLGADGALVGYAPGLEYKKTLLALEQAAKKPVHAG